ncbi:ATP-binding response regulator [Sphingobacterium haloxyli]|uniref:histidine kinase n=1 Tax=Sphingobacterium haloxyli TaxID=2100533 RepID=A0A2S9J7Z3_9SPHI|nr:hybrid sensor histidine kinase/response regulator [Sphingobacterium haloxyli]PRD48916.1 hybrid sensor histidine kinase/response regulator [Sphingobacterium haloxyli]
MPKSKKTFLLRKVLIGTIIAIFAYLSIVFIYQYIAYQKVKERLDAAYALSLQQSSAFYRLFSVYGEADNLFRQYTVDFDQHTYEEYRVKLDTIKYYIDSLSTLPNTNNLLQQSNTDIQKRDLLAGEFATLKKTIDDLVFMAQDSLPILTSQSQRVATPRYISADSAISKILNDTALNEIDTVVRKKQNLFNRIFNAKNDTLLANTTQRFNVQQIDVLQRNVENLIVQNETIYNRSLGNLRQNFTALRQKERALIQANYFLLNNLKIGVDNIRELERAAVREAEARDLNIYKENSKRLGNQLIISLSVMLFMMLFILYYQSKATTYEKRLEEEKDYAAKVAEEKTSVLANISHEVRSPINSLMGIIDILRKNGNKDTIQPEYLDSAAHEISVINSTVNDILSLSKLEVGGLEVKNEYFSPYRLLLDIVNLHTYQARKKSLSLTQQIDIDPQLEIYSSSFRIRQIVSNLISNAIKYTPNGTISIKAYTRKVGIKVTLFVEVIDTGLGIAPEHQSQIFRQYYMTDNKSKTKGFGLGLYISKLLSEQLQGDITLESAVGKGSTFTLSLPINKNRLENTALKTYTLADLPKDLQLVLIDDNRINILYLKHYFKDFPNIHTFEKASDALAFIQQSPVDAVITDVSMPEIDGWDVLREIRNSAEKQHTKVFAFTADTMHLEVEKNEAYAFDCILSKPLDEHQLVACIVG